MGFRKKEGEKGVREEGRKEGRKELSMKRQYEILELTEEEKEKEEIKGKEKEYLTLTARRTLSGLSFETRSGFVVVDVVFLSSFASFTSFTTLTSSGASFSSLIAAIFNAEF